MAKHLIADNLGWSGFISQGFTDNATNIEESMDMEGKGEQVNRVSKDIFLDLDPTPIHVIDVVYIHSPLTIP